LVSLIGEQGPTAARIFPSGTTWVKGNSFRGLFATGQGREDGVPWNRLLMEWQPERSLADFGWALPQGKPGPGKSNSKGGRSVARGPVFSEFRASTDSMERIFGRIFFLFFLARGPERDPPGSPSIFRLSRDRPDLSTEGKKTIVPSPPPPFHPPGAKPSCWKE